MARSRSLSMSGLLCRYGREAWAAVRHDLIKMLGESYLHATVLALVDDDRQHVGPHLRAMQDTDQAALVMPVGRLPRGFLRSEENTSELQSLMGISYAVFCLKNKKN